MTEPNFDCDAGEPTSEARQQRRGIRRISGVLAKLVVSLTVFASASHPLPAQNPPAGRDAAQKAITFDSVTIRPVAANSPELPEGGTSGDQFYLRNSPLTYAIVTALYDRGKVPAGFVDSLPPWVREERYDLTAKVSGPDYEALQRETHQSNPFLPREMLKPMLQNMLKERCNLAFHHTQAVVHEYSLQVGERGINPKTLKISTPSKIPSDAVSFGGAWQTTFTKATDGFNDSRTFYNMTMAEFARHVSSAVVVHDDTGLSARYDFTVELLDSAQDVTERYPVSALGLKWKKMDVVSDAVVMDHLDRPTPN